MVIYSCQRKKKNKTNLLDGFNVVRVLKPCDSTVILFLQRPSCSDFCTKWVEKFSSVYWLNHCVIIRPTSSHSRVSCDHHVNMRVCKLNLSLSSALPLSWLIVVVIILTVYNFILIMISAKHGAQVPRSSAYSHQQERTDAHWSTHKGNPTLTGKPVTKQEALRCTQLSTTLVLCQIKWNTV